MWCELRVMAKMRDVFTCTQGGIHNGIAILKGDGLAIQLECLFVRHVWTVS